MSAEPTLADFPAQVVEKIRFGDLDPQGHVNNAVFATFLESARVQVLLHPDAPTRHRGNRFVLGRLVIDFRKELFWPGSVSVGARIVALGRSSVRFEQALFQADRCAATAEAVVVLMDTITRKATPLPAPLREFLQSSIRNGQSISG